MSNTKTIELSFFNNTIKVCVKLRFEEPLSCFIFSLNKLLNLEPFHHSTNELRVQINTDKELQFRAPVTEYMITAKNPFLELTLNYSGFINGWDNMVEDNKRVLSFYSAWYPSDTNVPFDEGIVNISGCEDFFVLKSSYDTTTKMWTYGGDGYDDCNIVAFRKGSYFSEINDDISIYYTDKNESAAALILKDYYNDVLAYYKNELFGERDILHMDVVSLGLQGESGAYKRKGLIMFDCFGPHENLDEIKYLLSILLPHEIAHEWCVGANTLSWEDWLNEGTAEWSAMLYDLETSGKDKFDKRLQRNIEKAKGQPPILTEDGHRIEAVHGKAVMVLYPVFEKHGVDAIKKVLRLFSELSTPKTTAKLLAELSLQTDDSIAQLIHDNLKV